jgi:hypothetical protein
MIQIYDNFMPTPIQYQWELALLESNFSWTYLKDATRPNDGNIDINNRVESFGNTLFDQSENYISPEFPQFYGGIFIINDVIEKSYHDMYRFRVGLIVPDIKKRLHHNIHTDFSFDHTTALYYVNDSDGDTFFFDNDKNIVERITPKKGRMVVFDGNQLHASSSPTSNVRVAININYIN